MTEKLPFEVHAKIMLAGEYGVIAGGAGLTIPLSHYSAILREDFSGEEEAVYSRSELVRLAAYLKSTAKNSFHAAFSSEEWDSALNNGAWIQSSIPRGYGAGSSGAVSALVYHNFFKGNEELSLEQQKGDLAAIESFFHGKSSGVDALSCYRKKPLFFRSDGIIEEPEFKPDKLPGGYRLFLYNSETVMETAPLVSWFLEQMKESYFSQPVKYDYLHMNSLFIDALLKRKEADPAMLFRAISDFQYTHFRKMIPQSVLDLWIEGQVSNDYYLKLCGSGGGFLLGICYEGLNDIVEERLGSDKLIWI